jgi:hypothetical protein
LFTKSESQAENLFVVKKSPGKRIPDPKSSSEDEALISSFIAVLIPSRTIGKISVQFSVSWHFKDDFNCL